MVNRRRAIIIIALEFITLAVIALLIYVLWASAAPASSPYRDIYRLVPDTVSYQGRIYVNNTPFDGVGLFKFVIVRNNGAAAYWSNDGTGMDTAPFTPTGHITLTVSDGLFSVLLGNVNISGMTQITVGVFSYYGTSLRVWFNDGSHDWQMLTPDTPFSSVPYAFVSERASYADSASWAITSTMATAATTAVTATWATTATEATTALTATWATTATEATTALTATWATTATAATTALTATWATTASYALASPGGGGTITQVVAGTGLNGGGTSGAVTVTLNTSVTLTALNADTITATAGLNLGTAGAASSGNIRYSGDLQPGRNSTYYTGYVFVPLQSPLTSSSYDGDAIAASSWITLSSLFSAPAGTKAVSLSVVARDASVPARVSLGPNSSQYVALVIYTQVANTYIGSNGVIPCDANGNIYISVSENIDYVYIRIYGYFI